MPNDHYVAETYLKHFISPKLNGFLYAYNKENLSIFTPSPDKICCERDWDINPYFDNPRVIDDFLRIIEPKWNIGAQDITKIINSEEVKYYMAGYIAVLSAGTPTAVRVMNKLQSHVLSLQVNQALKAMPRGGTHDKSLEILINSGGLKAVVDSKYTQAIGTSQLTNMQWHFYKSFWTILENDSESPFLTSDFPVSYFYPTQSSQNPLRFVPISPRHAVLIELSKDKTDMSLPTSPYLKFQDTKTQLVKAKPSFVREINRITVQSAERFVISAEDKPWISQLLKKYQNWQMVSNTQTINTEEGTFIAYRTGPQEYKKT